MNMKELVAKSYWRSIRRGLRTMENVPEELRELVRELERREAPAAGIPAGPE